MYCCVGWEYTGYFLLAVCTHEGVTLIQTTGKLIKFFIMLKEFILRHLQLLLFHWLHSGQFVFRRQLKMKKSKQAKFVFLTKVYLSMRLLLGKARWWGRSRVTPLTADLAPASVHAYLKSRFGKTVLCQCFAAWILILDYQESVIGIVIVTVKMQGMYWM